MCTGHISLLKAAAYIVAQIVGAVAAHLVQASLPTLPRVQLTALCLKKCQAPFLPGRAGVHICMGPHWQKREE